MNFLQPLLLWGLALAAVPVIIHLIHQRRFRTMNWGAMYFLRKASQNAKGMARLKQWLVLAMRALAVMALALAVSRPLSGGWMGQAGAGNLPLAIILLDRSPSMEHQVGSRGESKRESGVRKIIDACTKFAPTRVVLIENVGMAPIEVTDPSELLELPEVGASDESAHWPSMVQRALEYVTENKPGNCQIWLCSDMKENDWDESNGLWASIRDEFPNIPDNIQFLMVPMTQTPEQNLGVRVEKASRVESPSSARIELTLRLWQESREPGDLDIPLDISLNGNVSRKTVHLTGRETILEDISVEAAPGATNGWGWVRLPADTVPSDNTSFYTYQPYAVSRTLVVNDDQNINSPLVWMSETSPDGQARNAVQVVTPQEIAAISLNDVHLILWQASMPDNPGVPDKLQDFIADGGQVIIFASEGNDGDGFGGIGWSPIETSSAAPEGLAVDRWKTDGDLLANVADGSALPVGDLKVLQYRKMSGTLSDLLVLARLENGDVLMARKSDVSGAVYFCGTNPDAAWSNLSSNGVVLYALIQRALAEGRQSRQGQNMRVAGATPSDEASGWLRIDKTGESFSSENASIAGVYSAGAGRKEIIAVNRAAMEDASPVLATDKIEELFAGLPLQILGGQEDDADQGVVQEIWRLFLLLMIAALLLEAWFSLPTRRLDVQTPSKGSD